MKRVTFNEYKVARDHGWKPQNEGLLDFLTGGNKKGVPAGPPAVAAPRPAAQPEPRTEEEILQAAAKASGYRPGMITGPSFANQGGFAGTKWKSWDDFMADPMPVMQKLQVLRQAQQQGAEDWGAGVGHRGLVSNS